MSLLRICVLSFALIELHQSPQSHDCLYASEAISQYTLVLDGCIGIYIFIVENDFFIFFIIWNGVVTNYYSSVQVCII